MTCRELTDFLDDYLEGNLTPDVRGRFEAHLTECRDCVEYLRGYRDTIRLAREACVNPDDELPADVPADLLQAILTARRR